MCARVLRIMEHVAYMYVSNFESFIKCLNSTANTISCKGFILQLLIAALNNIEFWLWNERCATSILCDSNYIYYVSCDLVSCNFTCNTFHITLINIVRTTTVPTNPFILCSQGFKEPTVFSMHVMCVIFIWFIASYYR